MASEINWNSGLTNDKQDNDSNNRLTFKITFQDVELTSIFY